MTEADGTHGLYFQKMVIEQKIWKAYLITFKNTNYSFRYENLVDVPRVRTSRYGKATFRFEAAQLWNSLPNYISATVESSEFVRLIRTWGETSCKCSVCKFSL